MESLKLYLLDVSSLPFEKASLLSEEERAKMNRFLKEEDRLLFLGSRLLCKQVLGASEFPALQNGKPYLEAGPSFSLSHSYPYVALLVGGASPIGVDLESKERVLLSKIEGYLPETDRRKMPSLASLWCLKEAIYKARGKDYFDPKAPFEEIWKDQVRFAGEAFFFKILEIDGFVIALASSFPFDAEAITIHL